MNPEPMLRDADSRAIGLRDRLLAEAVRAVERDGASAIDEPDAEAAARAAGGDLEERIVRRAAALTDAASLRAALKRARHVSAWIVLVALGVGALAGAGAVQAALGAPGSEPVNFFWALLSLLGIQTLLLIAWALIMVGMPRFAAVSPIGEGALAVGRSLARRIDQGPHQIAAIKAAAHVHARGAVGRWTLSWDRYSPRSG